MVVIGKPAVDFWHSSARQTMHEELEFQPWV